MTDSFATLLGVQLGYQVADIVAGAAYSFVMTTAICWLFHFIPFLRLRSTEEEEIVGVDEYAIGEYTHVSIKLYLSLNSGKLLTIFAFHYRRTTSPSCPNSAPSETTKVTSPTTVSAKTLPPTPLPSTPDPPTKRPEGPESMLER